MSSKNVREQITDLRGGSRGVRMEGSHPFIAELLQLDAEMESLVRKRDLTPADEVRAGEVMAEYDQRWKDGVAEMVRNGTAYVDGPRNGDGSVLREEMGGDIAAAAGGGARGDAMRVIDAAVKTRSLPEYAAEKVERLISDGPEHEQTLAQRWVTVTGDSAYRSAFSKLLADPERGHLMWTEREREAYKRVEEFKSFQRSMTLTDNAGGYLVPFQIDPAIILTNDGSANPLRRISRNVQAVGDVWHGVTSAGVTAEWLAEATEAADASPALGQPGVPLHKGSAFVPYSYEVGMDATNFTQELSKLLVDAADQLQAAAYTTGDGSGKPTGIITALTGTSSEVNATTDDTFAAGDVYKLQNALGPRFQPNAQWCANLSIINTIAQFETTNGALKFPEVGSGQLLRRPLHELSNMDGAIGTSGAVSNLVLLYGDFRNFVIADGIGTTIELIPNLVGSNRRPTGQRGLFMWFRTGSDSVNDAAFRMLDVASAS